MHSVVFTKLLAISETKFGGDSQSPLNAFKAFRYFSPSKIKSMNPSAADITSLSVVPFLNIPETIAGLMTELPTYLAKADVVNPSNGCLRMVERQCRRFAQLVLGSKKSGPNSTIIWCSGESFSLLNLSFGDSQEKALEDYVEASIMLQYNER